MSMMIEKEFFENLNKIQNQIDDLTQKFDELCHTKLAPIIEQYLKIKHIGFDVIGKITVNTGLIYPSYVNVTYVNYGYYGSSDIEYEIGIPISFFINENAVDELLAEIESDKKKESERDRQRNIAALQEQMQSLEKQLEKLNEIAK